CYFEIDITDNTGTLTAIVTETLTKKILAMRAEQVYGTVVVQNESLPLSHIYRQFVDKLLRVQLLKPLLIILDQKIGELVISSYEEKGPPTFAIPSEATKKQKLGPPTPTKQR
ncbi:hypothetical protein H5410_061190, partial [Solanum commersonii]